MTVPPRGRLRVVATPLGHLGDLSPRAREALETADAIACEDTRRTGRLLQLLGMGKKPLLSYFAPREKQKAGAILARLRDGQTVALVSDGGTPGVSDPGAVLVRAAHEAGVPVEPVPGPSAVALALSVSSAPADRFVFEGFLPSRAASRRARLRELATETRTIVFYEAPHRIASCLNDLAESFGADRRATIVREATKVHEEVREAALGDLRARFASGTKGEIVLVVEGGAEDPDAIRLDTSSLLDFAVRLGLTPDRAAREVAILTGFSRNRLVKAARERHLTDDP